MAALRPDPDCGPRLASPPLVAPSLAMSGRRCLTIIHLRIPSRVSLAEELLDFHPLQHCIVMRFLLLRGALSVIIANVISGLKNSVGRMCCASNQSFFLVCICKV